MQWQTIPDEHLLNAVLCTCSYLSLEHHSPRTMISLWLHFLSGSVIPLLCPTLVSFSSSRTHTALSAAQPGLSPACAQCRHLWDSFPEIPHSSVAGSSGSVPPVTQSLSHPPQLSSALLPCQVSLIVGSSWPLIPLCYWIPSFSNAFSRSCFISIPAVFCTNFVRFSCLNWDPLLCSSGVLLPPLAEG